MNMPNRFPRCFRAVRCCAAGAIVALLTASAPADPAQVAYERGNESIAHEDYPAAIRHLSMALQLNPRMQEAWFTRAWVYGQSGYFEQGVADWTRYLQLAPNDAEAHCNRAEAYARLGRPDLALADLNWAIRLSPQLAVAWSTRGWIRSQRGEHKGAVADYTQALKLDPDDVDLYVSRATCFNEMGEYERAVADLDRVLRVYPEDPQLLGMRGAAKAAMGRIREGMADLSTAIERNPHDAGANYEPWSKVELSAESLEHGEEQVRAMVKDRPGLAKFLTPDDELWRWAVRRMAGEALGEPIDWDPAPPLDSEAEHVAPMPGRRGRIRVKPYDDAMPDASADAVFEALWSHVVFELHNIGLVPRFAELRSQAATGRISKRQFVEQTFRHEHGAIQKTRAFYVEVQLPWVAKRGSETDPSQWFAGFWLDVDTAMQDFTDPQDYPWVPYGRQYDWLRVHALIDDEKHRDALALLETMLAQEGYPDTIGEIQYWRGECYLALGDLAAARKAVDAAIAFDPDDAGAYELRAEVYESMGDAQKSAADRKKVRQLDAASPGSRQ